MADEAEAFFNIMFNKQHVSSLKPTKINGPTQLGPVARSTTCRFLVRPAWARANVIHLAPAVEACFLGGHAGSNMKIYKTPWKLAYPLKFMVGRWNVPLISGSISGDMLMVGGGGKTIAPFNRGIWKLLGFRRFASLCQLILLWMHLEFHVHHPKSFQDFGVLKCSCWMKQLQKPAAKKTHKTWPPSQLQQGMFLELDKRNLCLPCEWAGQPLPCVPRSLGPTNASLVVFSSV